MLGKRIRQARLELGMSQSDLAGKDFSHTFISQIERGQYLPSAAKLAIIAERLGKPLSYFLPDKIEQQIVKASVNLRRAGALARTGKIDQAEAILQEFTVEVVEAIPRHLQAEYHKLMSYVLFPRGQLAHAVRHALTAEEMYEQQGDVANRWYCCYKAARELHIATIYDQAVELGRRALMAVSSLPQFVVQERMTLYLLGTACYMNGKSELAKDYFEQATLLPQSDDWQTLVQVYLGHSTCAIADQNWEEALNWANRASNLAEEHEQGVLVILSSLMACEHCIRAGQLEQAQAMLDEILHSPYLTADLRRIAYRQCLLRLAELEDYPIELCQQYETALEELLPRAGSQCWDEVCARWAIAKSRLRRDAGDAVAVVSHFADQALAFHHRGDAAGMFEFAAKNLERAGRVHAAYEMLKRAYELR